MSTDVSLPALDPLPSDGTGWYQCRSCACMVRMAARETHRAWHDRTRDAYACAACGALVREADRTRHDAWDASLVRLASKVGLTLTLG